MVARPSASTPLRTAFTVIENHVPVRGGRVAEKTGDNPVSGAILTNLGVFWV